MSAVSRDNKLRYFFGDDYQNDLLAGTLTAANIIARLRQHRNYKDTTIALFLLPLRKAGLIDGTNKELGLITKASKPRRVALRDDAETATLFDLFIHAILDVLNAPNTTRARYECALICILLYLDAFINPMAISETSEEIQTLKWQAPVLATYENKQFPLSSNVKVRGDKFIKSSNDTINKALVQTYISTCHEVPKRGLGVRYLILKRDTGVLRKSMEKWTQLSNFVNTKQIPCGRITTD